VAIARVTRVSREPADIGDEALVDEEVESRVE
jgi:hypothetical protein